MHFFGSQLEITPPLIFRDLISLIDHAGVEIMRIYLADNAQDASFKADQSPLTRADMASNSILIEGLEKLWPLIPILSEEGGGIGAEQIRPLCYWTIDPLDGTKEFLNRNGEFTVNIALIFDGKPVLGLVFAPALGQLYIGSHHLDNLHSTSYFPGHKFLVNDRCAMLRSLGNWQHIHASRYTPEKCNRIANIVASRSHPSADLAAWLNQLSQAPKVVEVGSSLKLCFVAQGLADAYPRFGPTSIWDTAAGHAIILAAGGNIFDTQNKPLCYACDRILNPYFVAYGSPMAWFGNA